MRPRWNRDGWIPRNDRSWSPPRFAVIDSEESTRVTRDAEIGSYLLSCASFVVRDRDGRGPPRRERKDFTDPLEQWRWVAARCHVGRPTWVVFHGLHYDYVLLDAERHLRALGWEPGERSLRAGARWARWRKGKRSMVIVDLFNYLPMPLEDIGKLMGMWKSSGRPEGAPRKYWLKRCRQDVRVTEAAFERLLDWWDDQDLGTWAFTSAGLAWAAFRHRFMREQTFRAHDDVAARTLEREALFGGRREIYRKGLLPEALHVELDYVSHYLCTAWEVPVPVELGRVYDGAEVLPDFLDRLDPDLGVIARVEVEVDAPVAPRRDPGLGITYPVGRFVTTLCQPELELVCEHGRVVRWLEVALYQLKPALEEWSEWVWGGLDGRERGALPRHLLKGWTRSLIGKFGQRRPDPEPKPGPEGVIRLPGIEVNLLEPVADLPWVEGPPLDPCRGEDSSSAVPAVMSWVHSAARVTLWRAMETVGREAVAYCDTDGMLVRVDESNAEAVAMLAPEIDPKGVSPRSMVPTREQIRSRPSAKERRRAVPHKTREVPRPQVPRGRMKVEDLYGTVELYRPQDYVLDEREVIKGLPVKHEVLGPRHYRAMYWPGIPWQLSRGAPGTYQRPIREVRLGSDYDRAWVVADGRCLPLEAEVRGGRTRFKPWARTTYARAGLELQDPEQASRIAAKARSPGS